MYRVLAPSLASHTRRGAEDKKEPFVHYQKLIFPADERQEVGRGTLLASSPAPTELFIVTALNSRVLEGKREIAAEETAKVSLLAH